MLTNKLFQSSLAALKTNFGRLFSGLGNQPERRWAPWLIVPAVAVISFVAISENTAPNIPTIAISADPLYAAAQGDKPTLALALSVEFPTVSAQYVDVPSATTDNSYSNTKEYLGYYDAESCYTYNNGPTETPVSPLNASDYKRFDRSGAATSRMCSDAFSGNFLNWASSSAIDMLRLALTGGDRYIDTSELTILQRAVIPNGDPRCMWNSANFPAKQLKKSGGTPGVTYFGAVPTAMAAAAGTNDIWVANTLNRIYFGTSFGGDCGNTSSYALGSSDGVPSDATLCATESGTCSFTGKQEIWYGAFSSWKVLPATNSIACTNDVFGDPIVGTLKSCYYRPLTARPMAAGALNSDGFFYARVQVCNVNGSSVLQDSRDYGLCNKYPNGNYKPTGVVQKYSDQLRLAAFGYLMDQTQSALNGRYGGVLRAPMKYVGAKTFDTNGVDNTPTTGNANKEWNESTGVFIANPDGNASVKSSSGSYLSGVITYLNQFGRTGPVAGRYKIYDPVGELHYEVVRYLQGLQPTEAAVSGITTVMYDGFPVATTWTDPYGDDRSPTADYSCLKSNIVVIGDINTHDGNRLPTANTANNIPDINLWRSIVQSFEKNDSVAYTDGQGTTRTTGNPNGANYSVPGPTDTSQIIGSAYWAHTHDIRGTGWTGSDGLTSTGGVAKQRPGLRVKTFVFDVNEYGQQNNPTTRHTANQFFMAAKYGGFEADATNATKNPHNTWGNPFKRDDGTVDNYVWQDTDTRVSRVGEANTYFLQSDARGVLSAFDDIFNRASTQARSIAGSANQSKTLTTVGNTIYQGSFDTSDWSGDLQSFAVTVDSNLVTTVSNTANWSAATQLKALSAPATLRNIAVGNSGATANPVAAPFSWATPAGTAGISDALRTLLDKPSPSAAADGRAQDRLNYLRGDDSNEVALFRQRKSLLGDIVNSSVVYSGAPSTSIISSTYAEFYNDNVSRTAAVFVGANDGMLHAFNAATGNELFAYIPSWLGSKLAALTSKTYVNAHQSYVDGTPAVAEAEVGSIGTKADWKTVLVGATGGGGQGVFALDVTDPAKFSTSKVMWEFTDADDHDLGNVTGRPQILKFRTSASGTTPATYKWYAVFASGLNNYIDDGAFSSTGKPALFLLDLNKPVGTAWTEGGNYYKISLPIDTTLSASYPTGLINFKQTIGPAGEVAKIFMGDMHGNIWKLDFRKLGSTDWNINKLSFFNKGTTEPYPMFSAKDSSSPAKIQPITMAPSIVFGPSAESSYVLFGTGKYLESTDKGLITQQSLYMVFDNGINEADTDPAGGSAINGRGRLRAGSLTAPSGSTAGVITIPAFTLGRAASDADLTQRSGWYIDFLTSGERAISGGTVLADSRVGDQFVFGTLIPGASNTAGTCSVSGGGGNVYQVNVVTGSGTVNISLVGIQGEPLLFELGSATYSPSDNAGRRVKTVKHQVIEQGSKGLSSSSAPIQTEIIAGRLSWRQINNYQDLKNGS